MSKEDVLQGHQMPAEGSMEGVETVKDAQDPHSSAGGAMTQTESDEPIREDETSSFEYAPLFTLQGHKRSVSSLSISPDGQQLVSSGSDGLLKLWSMATGALIATLDAAASASDDEDAANLRLGISDVAWSKDGRYLVCGGDDCIVRVWDATAVSVVKERRMPVGALLRLPFSPLLHSHRSTTSFANSAGTPRLSFASISTPTFRWLCLVALMRPFGSGTCNAVPAIEPLPLTQKQ